MGWIELHRKPGEDDKAFFAHELGPGFVVEDASRNRGEEAVGSTIGVFSVMVLAQEMNVSISRRVLWVGLKSF